ncbi:MAG: tRNA (N(6)-L-threonylcarbamoyladenosine(37)-C(2))-methylthiotransferase MtaB [Gemmataceae bacterium]|nr:tRNA (N(6)-L-threonylcarbamoyladenosine(37)-C(2))-methylthiotransferase MtaB [Gemmataceae bacterium]
MSLNGEALHSTATCRVVTLGCKVNQYESQYVKETLQANGYREAAADEPVDLCLVNTCTVTMEGDAKSRQLIRRLHQQHPSARIVVMGCYAARDPAATAKLPGVVRVVPDKADLPAALRDFGVRHWPRGIRRFDGHQRAFVKVQDGCLLHCSYCIIPQVRPTLTSRDPEEVADEVAALVAGGVREIVLTGVHLGHYGIDLSRGRPKAQWRRLWHLLDRLGQVPGEFRIRLSSLEAAEARDDLVAAICRQPRVVPHFHLCLQSGSDRVLALMRRRYTVRGFLQRCERLRRTLECPAFTTDVIVGFPGESEADFEATLRVVRDVGFAKVHVFSYSPRPGTPAAAGELLPPAVVADRRRRLLEAEAEAARGFRAALLGRRLDVLVEGTDPRCPGHVLGTSCRAVPVSLRGLAPALLGQIVPVRAISQADHAVLGEPLVEPLVAVPPAAAHRIALPLMHQDVAAPLAMAAGNS